VFEITVDILQLKIGHSNHEFVTSQP